MQRLALLVFLGLLTTTCGGGPGVDVSTPSGSSLGADQTSDGWRPDLPEAEVAAQWTARRISGQWPDLAAVGVAGTRFVAGGRVFEGDPFGTGTLWLSTSGWDWRLLSNDPAMYEGGYLVSGIVGTEEGGVAWGPNQRHGGTVVWSTGDGIHWQRVSEGSGPFNREPPSGGIAFESGGFVLYGTVCFDQVLRCPPQEEPSLLVSDNGRDWERVGTPATFTAITQGVRGDLLSIGLGNSEPTTWRSDDGGRTWARHGPELSTRMGNSVIVDQLAATPYGLVASGVDSTGNTTVWLSEDEKTFREVLSGPKSAVVRAIAVGSEWVVAVGSHGDQPLILVSNDGASWQAPAIDELFVEAALLEDVAFKDPVFVTVGWQSDGEVPLILRWEPGRES